MADIKIHDIKLDGSDFFANDEGFMKDLSEDELNIIGGKYTDKWWHWTSTVPGSGLVVYTVAATQGDG